jgi:hypothetical protein
MKRCHAAALALVGWYLITPLFNSQGKASKPLSLLIFDAPYAHWSIEKGFDSAKDCETERANDE